ncbi:hypothetical protein GYB22_10385 [bacterium]|nr:hypothetical protein [bacterium]
MRPKVILLAFLFLVPTYLSAQKHLRDNIDSLEREIAKMDSMHEQLDKQAKEIASKLEEQEEFIKAEELQQAQEMNEESNLPIWMIVVILIILLGGIRIMMKRNKKS